jgi:hypothetical protein
MNPHTKRLLILVLAFDALVVAGVALYFTPLRQDSGLFSP